MIGKKIILIFFLLVSSSFGVIKEKDSNDVYALAHTLKLKIMHLAGETNIKAEYMKLPVIQNKLPRHVLQKSLEVLSKINKYRQIKELGEVNVPISLLKDISSEDVYFELVRLNNEIDILLENISCPHIKDLSKIEEFSDKTSDDNYLELWSASLAMDELLGKGFTPKDNYEQSLLIVDIIKFLRNSQNIYNDVPKPELKQRRHPNHVLYATNQLLEKISKAEKNLWMDPLEVPKNPQRIITPTEVYDSTQTIVTELRRIRKRLGIDRFFEPPAVNEIKTPSDVLQNIEYAIELFPKFKFSQNLMQYDTQSLTKSVNELYALSQFVLKKANRLKSIKGIKVEPGTPPYIYNLSKMHVYQKSIETMEKINKLREINGLYKIAVPTSPDRGKDANDVYDMLIMIDEELSIILGKNGETNIKKWNYILEKDSYSDKTYSDIFFNLWKTALVIDTFWGETYTLQETFDLAQRIERRVHYMVEHLTRKPFFHGYDSFPNKREKDIFSITLDIYENIKKISKRANVSGGTVDIPKEKYISQDKVYNALRVVNASLIDLIIHFGIDKSLVAKHGKWDKTKSYSDIYSILHEVLNGTNRILKDESYED